jgi:hypothetical protein
VDGDGLDAQLAAGAQDAQRDLAAVGDQHFFHHDHLDENSGWSNSTGSPFSTSTASIVPATLGLDLVHHLHGLDDAQHIADLDRLALPRRRMARTATVSDRRCRPSAT